MRILSITAGAGGMYCGSCMRDNAFAAELMRQGHDVVLMPIYTPTLTDEPNVSRDRVFFGGVSVYLEQHSALFRKTPRFLDRLWDSPALLKLVASGAVPTNPRLLGEMTVSMLKGEHGYQAKEAAKLIDFLRTELPFDLITLTNALLIALVAPLKRALSRPVYCTLQGEDLFLEGLQEPYKSESLRLVRAQVGDVDAFQAVSEYYAEFMCRYLRIPESKMHVVPLGINLEGYAAAPRPAGAPFTVGYFARITPEKGLHLLVDAYCELRRSGRLPAARLEAAGYMAPEQKRYLRELELRMQSAGLGAEFCYRGVLDRAGKIAFLQSLDVISVPSTYREPKGIYLLEAMGCGVPFVQPRCGAFPEILRKTGGGILFEYEDRNSLANALLSLHDDPAFRLELGRRAYQGVREHYNIERSVTHAINESYSLAAGSHAAS